MYRKPFSELSRQGRAKRLKNMSDRPNSSKMAYYALVLFTEETTDAHSVISSSWINADSTWCWFPNTKSEHKKNLLMKDHSKPTTDWLKCPIRLLKFFESYQEAVRCISEAENTSNQDSEVEVPFHEIPPQRCVKREIESSDEAENDSQSLQSCPVPTKKLTKVSPGMKTLCMEGANSAFKLTPKEGLNRERESYQEAVRCISEAENTSSQDSEVELLFHHIPIQRCVKREIESSDEAENNGQSLHSCPVPSKKLTKVSPGMKTLCMEGANSAIKLTPKVPNRESESYQEAVRCISEAENTSSQDSEVEVLFHPIPIQRCVKREIESSDEAENNGQCLHSCPVPTKKLTKVSPAMKTLCMEGANSAIKLTPKVPNRESVTPTMKDKEVLLETPNLMLEAKTVLEEMRCFKNAQAESMNILRDLMVSVQRIETKLNTFVALSNPAPNFDETFACLPLSSEDEMEKVEERLKIDNVFRQQYLNLMLASYGRDCKAFVSCCLRKCFTNEFASKYTLTGRSKTGVQKLCFESTKIYKLIKEATLKTYSAKENEIRDAASDWLLQAKFRDIRRQKHSRLQ